MKPITFEEWEERFEPKPSAQDTAGDVCNDPDSHIFYDNGAVADMESNFVIKTDQVKRL